MTTNTRSTVANLLTATLLCGLAKADNIGILEVKQGSAVSIASSHGMSAVKLLKPSDQTVWRVSASSGSENELSLDPNVKSYERDRTDVKPAESSGQSSASYQTDVLAAVLAQPGTVTFDGNPVRAGYPNQPAMLRIAIDAARSATPGGAGVTVAIIDTGVDPRHPSLGGVLVPGYDFLLNQAGIPSELSGLDQSTVALLDQSTVALLDQKNQPAILNQSTVALLDQSTVALLDRSRLGESFGHGTMVAGLVHLIAPRAKIMPLRAFRSDGSGQLSNIISAIYFAVDNGAKVINMSFSFERSSPALQSALLYARRKNVLCVASAGNQGRKLMVFPAGYEASVVGIGSVSLQDRRSSFSNYGTSGVEMAAPGEALLTTYPGNNFALVWGTSFSTALVTGAGALLASMNSAASAKQLKESLAVGKALAGQELGEGRLDLAKCISDFRAAVHGSK